MVREEETEMGQVSHRNARGDKPKRSTPRGVRG